MTYAKNSTITAIHRPITNGMYNDTYTVIYSNGIRRNYTIKGAMNKKHFEFIQSATVESRYSKHTGKHTADIFTAPAEPKEEPTTEEQTAEEPTTTDTPADNNEEANNMRTYTAYVTDKNSKQSYFITADDYSNKKAFAEDLRRNGYAVHYIATPYTIDAVSDSYNKRREYRNEVARNTRAAAKAHSEATAEEPTTEEQAAEEPTTTDTPADNNEEVNNMKKRFFYLADINSTFAVTPMTKKEIISIGQELKELCAFISDDQTISGYTKDGRFFYYDNSNFDSFKKSDIINAVSVIYSDESGDYYWGGFDINEWGVANPTEDGTIIIADHDNIKEVDREDYHEDQTSEEPAADQEPETSENYIAWCGMIENDVITDEFETLSEAIDEVETKYTKEEQKALGITYCRLLCNSGQWLECLEEKTVDDVYYF